MDLMEFSLTGESPIYMQYRMRTVVEIMMKDKTNGYKTAFELAVALKVPKWFIQFEYIKRLIKTGKELYAEEELRKLDFKVDESVEMAKLLLGFCATQLVDVIKAMKSERKYRSLVASIPGESYRLALSLGKNLMRKSRRWNLPDREGVCCTLSTFSITLCIYRKMLSTKIWKKMMKKSSHHYPRLTHSLRSLAMFLNVAASTSSMP